MALDGNDNQVRKEMSGFGRLYRFVSSSYLTEERTSREADRIVQVCKLTPGMHVLDVGCGDGRIATELAIRGLVVEGIDISEDAISAARDRAKSSGATTAKFTTSDIRHYEAIDKFDCALSWYTSFGFASDDENREILASVRAVLRRDSRFLIEHIHRDFSLRCFQAVRVERHDGKLMVDTRHIDIQNSRMHVSREFIPDGANRPVTYSIRLFTCAELTDWLRQAGFTKVEAYAADLGALTLDSERMILIGCCS